MLSKKQKNNIYFNGQFLSWTLTSSFKYSNKALQIFFFANFKSSPLHIYNENIFEF